MIEMHDIVVSNAFSPDKFDALIRQEGVELDPLLS